MAVIGRCENGFLVDHKKSISDSVSSLSLLCKEAFFALYEPYFRSSCRATNGATKRKRKKSAQVGPTEEELEAAVHHRKVRETIATGVERLVQIGVDTSYFLSGNTHVEQVNVSALPEDRKDFAGLLADVSRCTRAESKDLLEPLIIKGETIKSEKDLMDRIISHPCDKPMVLNISGDKYILPADCSFLMSDATNLKPLVSYAQHNGLYNLLVLDPPWFNKSARRGSKYPFMSLWQIKSLPVPHLLAPGALVGIWVTNKQKYLRFTKTELFPHWSVELVAEWYWVKVTRKGELVTDLDSPHKKPYEPLLIGRFKPKMDGLGTSCLSVTKESQSAREKMESSSEQNKYYNVHESSQRQKRKIIECDVDDDEIKKCCVCDSDKTVATAMPLEWTSFSTSKPTSDLKCTEYSGHKRKQLDVLHTKSNQRPTNCCLNCLKLDHKNKVDLSVDMESSNDVVIQKDHTVQEATELQKRKWLCATASDLNFAENVRDTKCRGEMTRKEGELLPYHQVICSVPCKIHSRKPPLNEIISQYVPRHSLCLEMFARNLTPHWTSWGNEVLRFQSMEYFEQFPPKQEPKDNIT